ncbi:MAG: Hpt domain-containing protein [Treponema sp.]|nr:Hpt domain-containing protein [Treponema sp.]
MNVADKNAADNDKSGIVTEPVLDRAMGLVYSAGDEKLFNQLLRDFHRVHSNDIEKIRSALADGDKRTACRLAHTLKSSSALIGAAPLSGIAFKAEKAFGTGSTETPETYYTIIADMETALTALVRELDRLFSEDKKKNKNAILDREKAMALLEQIEPLLAESDSAVFDLREEMVEVFTPLGEDGEELINLIDDIEFQKAKAVLLKIKDDLFRS